MSYDEDNYRHPRSGRIQTQAEVLGIYSDGRGKRVSDTNRDDVIHHIAACEVHGILRPEESEARQDEARKAMTEGDLIYLVRDLPSEATLDAAGARKRLDRLANGRLGGLSRWALTTKPGRAAFHTTIAVLALMLAIIPLAVLPGPHNTYSTPAAVFAISAAIVGFPTFIVDLVFGIHWFDKNG